MFIKKGKQQEKYKAHVKSKDFYDFYSLLYFKEYIKNSKKAIIYRDNKYYISYSEYCKIINSLNIQIRDLIINDSFDFNMPYKMGLLSIRKQKREPYINENGTLVNTLPIDWNTTLKLWKEDEKSKAKKTLIRHYNEHTKGYVSYWYYSVRKANYKYKSGYWFIPCRTAKIQLAKVLKDPDSKVDYYLL